MLGSSNKYLIPMAIVIAGLLIGGVLFYLNQGKTESLSPEEAAEKAIAFINQTIEENVTASLVEVVEESSFYKVRLKIEELEYEFYITKDGKFLFPTGFNLEEQAELVEEQPREEIASLDSFTQCLTDKGMKFYGSKYCGWCDKQKELFGDSLQYLNYIECIDPETDQWSKECQEAGIKAVPTWQLPDGEITSDFQSFEQLAEISACPLE